MKDILSYITEELRKDTKELSDNVLVIVDYFLEKIDWLKPDKKQHFLTRLSLCKDIEVDWDKNECMESVKGEIKEVMHLIKDKKWDEVIENYVCRPYKGSKKKIYNFLTTLKEEEAKKYVCYGHLMNTIDIIERNVSLEFIKDCIPFLNQILDLSYLMELHRSDVCNVKDNCGTIYINFIGSLRSLLEPFFHSSNPNVENLWRDSRMYYITKPFTQSNLYAVTHTIINESHFYTKKVDQNDYRKEVEYIDRWLTRARQNYYRVPSLDLLCEAALCEKFVDKDNFVEWKYVNKFLQTKVSSNTHILQSNNDYLDSKKDNFNKNEHTNILYILLNKL